MALIDPNYKFTVVDVESSAKIKKEKQFLFATVIDETFLLKIYLLRLYSKEFTINDEEKVYNNHHSRAP